ncbi:hypothetical protein [Paraburkholderia sp. 22B1P]|jgi:hypothetical protein|uniref:hypothetical protein n=1 Tax=Paraburkholderia sp. 22B1P TaxID=3080498 RepID=UPI0030CC5120
MWRSTKTAALRCRFVFPAHVARSHSSVGASGANALEWLILVRRRAACAAKNQKHLTNDRSQISFLR